MTEPTYKRVLLKLSGEMLAGSQGFGVDPETIDAIARQVDEVASLGVQIAIVIGGGNFVRGVAASAAGMDRTTADHMGMLSTVINALALQEAIEKHGRPTRVQTAIKMHEVAEPYIRRRAIRHLEKGRVVIFGGGTGNPYFSTDTAASLRAMEIQAEVILKATKVEGIYSADPATNPDAKFLSRLRYIDVLQQGLRVMDATAISLCMDHLMPIVVFKLAGDNVKRVVLGEQIGTTVHGD